MINSITSGARIILVLLFGLAVAACTDTPPKGGGDILVIGDSVMAWNGSSDQAIPDVIASTLGRQVTNKAIPGAKFASDNTHPSPKGSALIGAYLAKAISERDPRSQ